ncbi:universal stress protein [Desulfobacterota bacterium AH_259_B03_O07]|nr:universal stress protein [Desulfobacterota bacterium AH_259_B03_O07]
MQLNKILWASDGSKESDEALKYLGLLSGSYTFHTIGLGVIRPFHVDHIQIPTGIKKELSQIELEQRKRGYERIEEALSKLGLNNKLSTRIETGMPHELILKVAEEENVDLIVMGKRGLGLLDRLTIGSTSLRVLRNSRIPVLCVKKRDGGRSVNIKNILVPLDISENIDSALKFATELATKLNSKISVVNVIWIDGQMYDIPPRLVDDLIAQSKNELRNRVEKIQRGNDAIEIKMEVLHGFNPAITVADYSNVNEFDLIVVNTHGRKGIKKLFLGSFTEKIIQESNCPVLALKP